MRYAIVVAFVLFVNSHGWAAAGANSYVLGDGTSRAPAVTLHCATVGANATPCGTVANPLVVGLPSGSATGANQQNQATLEQAIATAMGAPGDSGYAGGSGTTIALLKGVFGQIGTGINAVPVSAALVSRSVTLLAQTSTVLFPANGQRRYLSFQAPQGAGIWINLLGGVASPGGIDCAYFAPGTFYESGQFVNRGSITVYASVATIVPAWEG